MPDAGTPDPVRSGDVCPACCAGYVKVDSTRVRGEWRIQYLHCPACGKTHGKNLIPLAYAPRRRPRPQL